MSRSRQLHSYGNQKRVWQQAARKGLLVIDEARSIASYALNLRKDPFMHAMDPKRFNRRDRTQASTVVRCLITQAILAGEEVERLYGELGPPEQIVLATRKLSSAEGYAEGLCKQRIGDDDSNVAWDAPWTEDEVPEWVKLVSLLLAAHRLLTIGLERGEKVA